MKFIFLEIEVISILDHKRYFESIIEIIFPYLNELRDLLIKYVNLLFSFPSANFISISKLLP